MDEQAIADSIFRNAKRYATSKRYILGDGADQQFRAAAELAAGRIVQTRPNSNARRALRAKARRNFHRMIDAMIASRAEAYASDAERMTGNIIGEVTLAMAHSKLCPIWPFC